MKKTVFFTHSVALYSLFILGSAVIQMPQSSADEFTFTGYLLSFLICFLLYIAVIPIADRIFAENIEGKIHTVFSSLVLTAVAVASAFLAAKAFSDFILFAHSIMLPNQGLIASALIFGVAIAFFSFRRQENILKFALLSFWFTVIAIIVFALLTAHNYNLRNIFVFRLPTVKQLFKQSKPYFINPVLPSLLLPVYNVLLFKKCRKKEALTGLTAGFILLGICVLSSVLLFGPHFAGTLDYPYASAVSTVTVGRLFTRMDGFSYYIYFSSALIQITVCIFIIKSCLEKINKKLK